MSWTLTTSGSAIANAGTNANSTIIASGSTLALWSDEAEGIIEQSTNTAWVANHTGLSTSVKGALSNIAASFIAMRIVSYDPTGYLAREADIILNVNDDRVNKGLKMLEGKADTLKAP